MMSCLHYRDLGAKRRSSGRSWAAANLVAGGLGSFRRRAAFTCAVSSSLTEAGGARTFAHSLCVKRAGGTPYLSSLLAMHPIAVFVASACLLGLHAVHARPTIYMVNENDKLEPALVPVSSTVIPLPVYKVSTSLGFAEKKGVKTSEPGKLITGGKKKLHQDDNIAINIKQISKEEYELQS